MPVDFILIVGVLELLPLSPGPRVGILLMVSGVFGRNRPTVVLSHGLTICGNWMWMGIGSVSFDTVLWGSNLVLHGTLGAIQSGEADLGRGTNWPPQVQSAGKCRYWLEIAGDPFALWRLKIRFSIWYLVELSCEWFAGQKLSQHGSHRGRNAPLPFGCFWELLARFLGAFSSFIGSFVLIIWELCAHLLGAYAQFLVSFALKFWELLAHLLGAFSSFIVERCAQLLCGALCSIIGGALCSIIVWSVVLNYCGALCSIIVWSVVLNYCVERCAQLLCGALCSNIVDGIIRFGNE
ncbi:unnamed protein product [Orchesella dallaii]|uniref:Uncharacterized protein n=1 Tax=Orchesella dallaii TaxID=48710 RepID=A0ABP1Q1J1_9HEXA